MGNDVATFTTQAIRQHTFLPLSIEQHAKVDPLLAWYRSLWTAAPESRMEKIAVDQLRLYAAMVIDNGFPKKFALSAIANFSERTNQENELVVPMYPRARKPATVVTLAEVPAQAARILRTRLKETKIVSLYTSKKKVERALRGAFARFKPKLENNETLRFHDIAKLGPYLAVLAGVPPYQISVLSQSIRPIGQNPDNANYPLGDVTKEHLSHFLRTGLDAGSKPKRVKMPEDQLSLVFEPTPQWTAEGRTLLRDLCKELRTVSDKKLSTKKQKANAQQILDSALEKALTFTPADSIVCLAIKWAGHLLIEKGSVNPGTVGTYFDRAVTNGLMASEESFSLSDWEPDDFHESLDERQSEKRFSTKHKELIRIAYSQCVNFITRELHIPAVSFNNLDKGIALSNARWALISPLAFDRAIQSLWDQNTREGESAAVTLALGYYCGLRIGEVRRLTLDNIVFNDRLPQLDVEILRGKSAYARRRLPVADLAPPFVVELVKTFARERRMEIKSNRKLSTLCLFGKEGDDRMYTYSSFSHFALQTVQSLFGEGATFHMLRHNFCSFLFLRWHAMHHEDFNHGLRSRSHHIFQPELQGKLRAYFQASIVEDGEHTPYDLISIIKLTGHSSPAVMFQYYVHSFSEVQAHTASQLSSWVGELELNGKQIARLLPKIASSATRVKYHDDNGRNTIASLTKPTYHR